jgi:hypothetical protein
MGTGRDKKKKAKEKVVKEIMHNPAKLKKVRRDKLLLSPLNHPDVRLPNCRISRLSNVVKCCSLKMEHPLLDLTS